MNNIFTKKVKQFSNSDTFFITKLRVLNIKVGKFCLKVDKKLIAELDPRMSNYDYDFGVMKGSCKLFGRSLKNDSLDLYKIVKKEDGTTENVKIVECLFEGNSVGIKYLNLETRKWVREEIIVESEFFRMSKTIDLSLDVAKEEVTDYLKNTGDIKRVSRLLPDDGTSSIRVDYWSGGNVIWYRDIVKDGIWGCRTEGIFEDPNLDCEKGMVVFEEPKKIEDIPSLSKEDVKKIVAAHKAYYIGPVKEQDKTKIEIVDLYDQHGCGTFTKEDSDYLTLCICAGKFDKTYLTNVLYNKPRNPNDNI